MHCGPRSLNDWEVAVRVKFRSIAPFQLVNCDDIKKWIQRPVVEDDCRSYLTGRRRTKGEIDVSILSSEGDESEVDSAAVAPRHDSLESIARLFIGEVVGTGSAVGHLQDGFRVCVVASPVGQAMYNNILITNFNYCVPLPDFVLARGIESKASSADRPTLQQQDAFLIRLVSVAPSMVEALHCCNCVLKPVSGELIGVCTVTLARIIPLLQWLLPRDVIVFIITREKNRKHDTFFEHSTVSAWRDKLFFLPLNTSFHKDVLHSTGGLGLNALILCRDVDQYLWGSVDNKSTCHRDDTTADVHSKVEQTAVGKMRSTPDENDVDESRSLLSAAIMCLAPGGRIVAGCDIKQADEVEVFVMRKKGVSLSFLNPCMWAISQLGIQIHLLVEVIQSLSLDLLWSPTLSMIQLFSDDEIDAAVGFRDNNSDAYFCVCDSTSAHLKWRHTPR